MARVPLIFAKTPRAWAVWNDLALQLLHLLLQERKCSWNSFPLLMLYSDIQAWERCWLINIFWWNSSTLLIPRFLITALFSGVVWLELACQLKIWNQPTLEISRRRNQQVLLFRISFFPREPFTSTHWLFLRLLSSLQDSAWDHGNGEMVGLTGWYTFSILTLDFKP